MSQINYFNLRYRLNPDYNKYYKQKSESRYELKKEEIRKQQNLKCKTPLARLARRIKYAQRTPERIASDKKRVKECRERKKFNGYTKDELEHIDNFLLEDELKIRSMVYIRAYRVYQRNNKYGIPTASFR